MSENNCNCESGCSNGFSNFYKVMLIVIYLSCLFEGCRQNVTRDRLISIENRVSNIQTNLILRTNTVNLEVK